MGHIFNIKEKKFIYIHIPKTGGSSLQHIFNNYKNNVNTFIGNKIKGHITFYQTVENLINHNLTPSSYIYLTLIRNPWDRMISLYFYIKQYPVINHGMGELQNKILKKTMSFYDFIDFNVNMKKTTFGVPPTLLSSQSNYIKNYNNDIKLNYILKLEDGNNGIKNMLNKENISINISLPHINKSLHKDYISYYNNEYMNKIYEWEKTLIDTYNYTF